MQPHNYTDTRGQWEGQRGIKSRTETGTESETETGTDTETETGTDTETCCGFRVALLARAIR